MDVTRMADESGILKDILTPENLVFRTTTIQWMDAGSVEEEANLELTAQQHDIEIEEQHEEEQDEEEQWLILTWAATKKHNK
eukprot:4531249-Amphidinium_carterae.1